MEDEFRHDHVDIRFYRRMMDDVAKNFAKIVYCDLIRCFFLVLWVANENIDQGSSTDDNVQSTMLQYGYALLHLLSKLEMPTGTFAFTCAHLRPYVHDNLLQIHVPSRHNLPSAHHLQS